MPQLQGEVTIRGRKPIPEAVKQLRAGVRKPDLPAAEAPRCPDWLDDVAQTEWARLAPALASLGLLTAVDVAVLAGYCQAYAQWRAATEQVRKDGMMVTGSTGQQRLHPAADYADKCLGKIRTLAVELGFTPSARQRIEIPEHNAELDQFDSFGG